MRWNTEKIKDFERKLGFHSAEMGGTTQTNDDQKCTGYFAKENCIALNPVKKEDEGCTFFIKVSVYKNQIMHNCFMEKQKFEMTHMPHFFQTGTNNVHIIIIMKTTVYQQMNACIVNC